MIVTTTRGDLSVVDEGSGPAVLLFHPLALDGETWRPLIDFLAPSFRVLAIDSRGHGDARWDGVAFSIEDLAIDASALLDALEVADAGVLGMSMGGSTAIALAIARPDQVRSLVLADTTASYGEDRVEVWAERAQKAVSVPRPQQVAFQLDRWFSPSYLETGDEQIQRMVDQFVATDSEAHAAACLALGGFDATADLGLITAPTLVVVGAEDYATPPAMSEVLHAGIPGSTLEVVDGSRHVAIFEHPEMWPRLAEHLAAEGAPS